MIVGVLSVRALLVKLKEMEIRTLMVEGGARVIGSFLEAAGESVDTVVVTVAPTFVGKGGVGYGRPEVRVHVTSVQSMKLKVWDR